MRSLMRSLTRSVRPVVVLSLVLSATLAAAGDAGRALRIGGRVVDAGSGAPLESAQVFAPDAGVGALTDRDGRYVLDLPDATLAQGEVRVRVELIGYRSEERRVPLTGDLSLDSLTVDFRLQATALRLQELVVSGEGVPMADAAAYRSAQPANLPAPGEAHVRFRRPGPFHEREQYAHIAENDFRAASDHPLSTFSIDVDRASYSNVRRFLLRERRLPPIDAVQVEEMINYFPYTYELPGEDHPVAVTTELGRAPWQRDHQLLRIGLASRPIDTDELPPSNLVFLLDVSGSMSTPDKLPLVKASLRLLVEQLRPVDRVAIVVYAGAAGLVLEPTSGAHRERILEAIERLEAGGSTAGGAGLRLAYRVARQSFVPEGNNRVILATDGDFNVGESSDAAMIRLIEDKRRDGTFLTVLGFGTGNLQSTKMQGLAQHGNGNYAYIDGIAEARKVLVGEMGGTLLAVASDVKIQIEFNPARVRAYRLIGYENRLLAAEDFNDDGKDAGELGAGHTVTALYEIVPVGGASDMGIPHVDPLRYQSPRDPADRIAPTDEGEVAFVKVRYKEPGGATSRLLEHPVLGEARGASTDLRFASAVAGFGMLLRESEHRGSITARQVLALAEDGLGDDPHGYRRGFLELVRMYQALTGDRETDALR